MGNLFELPPVLQDREPFRRRARELLRIRQARRRCLDESLVSGSAWDLMVALYSLERESCSVSKLSELADVRLTTTLRQLHHLEDEGLVRRTQHMFDRRSVEIHLTDGGRRAMDTILAAAIQ